MATTLTAVLIAAVAVSLYALYRWLLPRPLPGIPYNEEATRSIFGDIPALIRSGKQPTEWLAEQPRKHRSAMVQVFTALFGKPQLVLVDYHESYDIMMRRKEFDRSQQMIEFFKGLIPNHHITFKTDTTFKAHRRLVQDLMTPSFLNNVAAPSIYASAQNLVTLWQAKTRVAEGRPFSATHDVFYAALDAVHAFSFGTGYPHRAAVAQLRSVTRVEAQHLQCLDRDAPIDFPLEPIHESSQAVIDLVDEVEKVAGSPAPKLAWWWLKRSATHRRAARLRDIYIKEQVLLAVARLESAAAGDGEGNLRSAVDLMMDRERRYAEKEGRDPVYWSDAMNDEVFGFVVAGHETTSTTLLWGLKFLAANPEAQTLLREALEAAHPVPLKEKRNPSAAEITQATIPYLDATMEEMLRLSATAPLHGRDAEADTTLLGHHIPRGTAVLILQSTATEPGYPVDEALRSPSSKAAAKERGIRVWDPKSTGDFQPERWLRPGPDGSAVFDSAAGPSIAFGVGIRACFGRRLAYLEMRLLLTLLVWNFRMQPCPEELSSFAAVDGVTHKPAKAYVRLARTR